jgi:hypothetical protein
MKILMTAIVFLLLNYQEVPETKPNAMSNEVAWSAYLCRVYTDGGVTEYRLPAGGRVDILTDDIAWEVEWTKKWPESIGQAIYYASATNKKPGVWLLKKAEDDENWNECLAVIQYLRGKGIDIEFRTENVSK